MDQSLSLLWLLLLLSDSTGQVRGTSTTLQIPGWNSWSTLWSLLMCWGSRYKSLRTYFSGWKTAEEGVLNNRTYVKMLCKKLFINITCCCDVYCLKNGLIYTNWIRDSKILQERLWNVEKPRKHTSGLCLSLFTCSLDCIIIRICISISTNQLLKD